MPPGPSTSLAMRPSGGVIRTELSFRISFLRAGLGCGFGGPLIAAGVVGAGAGAVVGRLPTLAVVLVVLAAGSWWYGQRRRSCPCAPKTAAEGGCGCKGAADPLKLTSGGRR
ncbi:hypothetical protein ACWGIU_01925 [Streptomyces sp. NPDC054840]